MKRHADDRSAETNAVRVSRCFCQCHLRRGHGLPTAGVMLADKALVETKLVGVVDQLDVAIERQRRIFRRMMQRHHED